MSPKNSSLAFDDLKEQSLEECFVPELNVIFNKQYQENSTFSFSAASDLLMTAVEVKGMFTVSF